MISVSNNKALGNWGEQLAATHLKKQGYQIVANNFRCCYGEIDLIAKEGPIWCFVEVKTRRVASFGYGYDAVTHMKRQHIIKVAQFYLNREALYEAPARFDIVSIDFISNERYRIELIRNAFYMS